jgi:hypothetical protein
LGSKSRARKSRIFSGSHSPPLVALSVLHVHTHDTPKYTSSSDDDNDDDVGYSDLFKGLDRSKVDKINELIDALNEKDRLLEKKEDLLHKEHDKCVEVEKSLALAMKKNELLSFELSSCHASIYTLESTNVDLNVRIEKLSVASSSLEHASICNRCKDFDIDACNDHVSMISKLNDYIAKLHAQLKTCKDECEKIKFATPLLDIPTLKMDLASIREPDTKSHKPPNFIKEKGKAPMASSSHPSHDRKNHAFIYANVKNSHNIHHDACVDHAMPAMCHDVIYSSHAMMLHLILHMFMVDLGTLNMLFLMHLRL